MEILQSARQAAVDQAGEAARKAEGLQASARQHAWGQRLFDTLLTDQLHRNQECAEKLRTLLAPPARPGGAHCEADTASNPADDGDDGSAFGEAPSMGMPAAERPIIARLKAHLLQMQAIA